MKVKIGDNVYDADEEPIMIIFKDQEERQITIRNLANMVKDATKYCVYPKSKWTDDEILKWMRG